MGKCDQHVIIPVLLSSLVLSHFWAARPSEETSSIELHMYSHSDYLRAIFILVPSTANLVQVSLS